MTSLQYATRYARRILPRSSHHRSKVSSFRCFSASPAEESSVDSNNDSFSSPKVKGLYDKIVTLPEEDVNILGALVIQILGRKIFPGEFGGGGVAAAHGQEAGAIEEVQKVKTIFDLKLIGFDAKAKIKVIKEVRSIAGLGLKEAKDLVESAPKVIQKDLKPEKAEELKALLEAVGAQVEIV
jgi:large subunit ribosomal protein L7/L12